MLLSIFEVLSTIFGVFMSASHFFQAYKLWKRKSSDDLSLVTVSTFAVGTMVWLVYGLLISSIPLIISFAIGLLGNLLVLALVITYKKKKRK